jgi:hypothetical protein
MWDLQVQTKLAYRDYNLPRKKFPDKYRDYNLKGGTSFDTFIILKHKKIYFLETLNHFNFSTL